jgi:serine/threonine protein kinase
VSVDLSSAEGVYKLCPSCHYIYPAADRFCARDRSELVVDERIFVGKYILLRKVGEGSMGAVYEAEQPQMGRKVAVKRLRPDPEVMMRFEREVQAAGAINHQNVVTIFDSGLTPDGAGFIAMEFLEGEHLAQYIESQPPLSPSVALPLWLQAVRAMAAAHGKGIVHRDLKPENIFLSRQSGDEGGGRVLKVLDFGIAKFHKRPTAAKGTTPGMIIGTMQYMAPEQLQGSEADPRADVYALGLILVEMLVGRLPWGQSREQSYAQFALRMVQPPQKLSEIRREERFSPELQRLVDDMLAIEPQARPAHAGELLPRLRQVPEAMGLFPGDSGIGSEGPRALERTSSASVAPPTKRMSAWRLSTLPPLQRQIAMFAPLLLLLGLGLYFGLRSSPSPPPPPPPVLVVTPPKVPDKPAAAPEKPVEKPAGSKPSQGSRPAAAHSAALQVQFATTEAKGVALSCGGRKLGAPSCSGAGICKWVVSVSSGQKCMAERGKSKKLYPYAELQKTAPDRKNLIHILVHF